MKNTAKILGIVLAAAVIGFIASCSGAGAGSGGGGNTNNGSNNGIGNTGETNNSATNEPLVFESVVNGEVLQIIISREPINRSFARSTITPKNGDYYEIIHGNKVISKGIISSVGAADKDGWSEIVFTPSSDSPCGNKEPFSGTLNPGDVVDSSGLRNGGKLTIPQIPYEGGVLTGIEAEQVDDSILKLSGQVWTYDGDEYTYKQFTGNKEITGTYEDLNGSRVNIGGNGSISNGLLNYSIGKPSKLWNIEEIFSRWGEDFTSLDITNIDAQFATLSLMTDETVQLTYYYGKIIDEVTPFHEEVVYFYVDRDVIITGDGKTNGYGGKTTDLNLSLKKGWNTLYCKIVNNLDYSEGTVTFTLANPSHLRWIYPIGLNRDGNGGYPSPSVRR